MMTTKREKRPPRIDSFRVEHDRLIRSVVPRRGKPYEHTCTLDAFREVLWAGEDLACGGFTIEDIAEHADLPITQVAVARLPRRTRRDRETSSPELPDVEPALRGRHDRVHGAQREAVTPRHNLIPNRPRHRGGFLSRDADRTQCSTETHS